MSGVMNRGKQNSFRARSNSKRKWQRNEELALIDFIKRNRDFEKPCARIYYTKFLFESRIDVDWRLVRCKVRNMRVSYVKAKEFETNKVESNNFNADDLRFQIVKMCWYVDEFDILFPNLMDNNIDKYSDPIFDYEFSKDDSSCNIDKSRENFKINSLPEEESRASSLSRSVNGDSIAMPKDILNIKKERHDTDASINEQEPDQIKSKLGCEKINFSQETRQQEIESEFQQTPFRNRPNPIRKWQRNEEVALIVFLKQNRDFEKPNARMYYTKFLLQGGIDADWQHVRNKVRNMRVSYRKAKEHEIRKADSNDCNLRVLRNKILKICWFVDEFDILFPNDMDNSACLQIYKDPDPILDDEFSKDDSSDNVDNSITNFNNNLFHEDDSTISSLSNSEDEDIIKVQQNLLSLKKQKQNEDTSLKQQELDLAKEKLNFEKEKFRQEILLKEKEIESEEKLKIMELQMKERIALKKLEIEEMVALSSIGKPQDSYIYQNLN